MIAIERRREILHQLERCEVIRTIEFAKMLNCTEETIRRDLDKLSSEGKIIRTHGGATAFKESSQEINYRGREEINTAQKQAICKVAATLIQAHETIVIDESSTAIKIIDYLPAHLPLTIVTNSIVAANHIIHFGNSNLKLIQLGGVYNSVSQSYEGQLSELGIQRIKIDRFFFSCKGVHESRGAAEANQERSRAKQFIMNYSAWNCLLADSSKINHESNFYFATPNEIDLLITDEQTLYLTFGAYKHYTVAPLLS